MTNEERAATEQHDEWDIIVPPKGQDEKGDKIEDENFTNFKIADGCSGLCGGLTA